MTRGGARASEGLTARHRQAKAGRELARAKGRKRRRCAVVGGTLTHPSHAVGAHRRSQVAVRYALGHLQTRKEDLLYHGAARVAELGLERHRRFFIEPQTIPEAVLVLGRNG